MRVTVHNQSVYDWLMRVFRFPLWPVSGVSDYSGRPACGFFSRLVCWLILGASILSLRAQEAKVSKDEFSSLVELAPLVVGGKSLAISIYARTRSDRRYGEQFAERVTKVIHEAVTESTGKGLVIIGAKGEPHPMVVFKNFLALADAGKLDPAIAAQGQELSAMLERWQAVVRNGPPGKREQQMNLDFEKIVPALPMPLKGVGSKLYQLAWEEKFDEAKVETRMRALRPGDLERRDLFKAYDWVFFLPPKGVFDRVLDDIIRDALKKEKLGFATRMVVKSALLVVKPKIRRAVEGMRQSMMFTIILQARTTYSKEDISKLSQAYLRPQMPGDKSSGGSDHERAVEAVRTQLRKLEEGSDAAQFPPTPAINGPVEQVQ